MSAKKTDFDYLPPEEFLSGVEVVWLRAFGTARNQAYEITDGATFKLSRHKVKQIVRSWDALDDLNDFTEFMSKVGDRLCDGQSWRQILADIISKNLG